jgi:hypothetical protein
MESHGAISPSTISNRFGTWNKGLKAAGLATSSSAKISSQEVIVAIQSLADELGRVPTASEMAERGACGTKVAQRRFGDWNTALRQAGFDSLYQRNIPDEQLFDEIARLKEELGYVPSTVDMKNFGQFSLNPYIHRFNSWKQAVEAAGFEYRGVPSGRDHSGWKGGHGNISYGPNWHEQRKQALERDELLCQMPGCPIDRESHRNQWDRDLNVHHITPLATFVDSDGVVD